MTARSRPRRRAVSGFALYDVANSAFVTTVVTAVGGPFLTALAEDAAGPDGRVQVLLLSPRAASVFAYAVSLSVLLQVVALPVLGALADRPLAKRRLLVVSTAVGSAATVALALTPPGTVLPGLAAFVVANVAYGAAILAYNAYLGDVAELPDRHRVSALRLRRGLRRRRARARRLAGAGDGRRPARHQPRDGGAPGHRAVGGVVGGRRRGRRAPPGRRPGAARLGPDAGDRAAADAGRRLAAAAARIADGAARPARHRAVPAGVPAVQRRDPGRRRAVGSRARGGAVRREGPAARRRDALPAPARAAHPGHRRASAPACPGGWPSGSGAKRTLLATARRLGGDRRLRRRRRSRRTTAAYALGVAIAIVLGGSQAIARSLFSSMVPARRQASFFGFYELAERGTAWVGTLLFAVVLDVTGSYRRRAAVAARAVRRRAARCWPRPTPTRAVEAARQADADADAAAGSSVVRSK